MANLRPPTTGANETTATTEHYCYCYDTLIVEQHNPHVGAENGCHSRRDGQSVPMLCPKSNSLLSLINNYIISGAMA